MATERSEINRHNHVILGGKHHVGGLDIAVTVGFLAFKEAIPQRAIN